MRREKFEVLLQGISNLNLSSKTYLNYKVFLKTELIQILFCSVKKINLILQTTINYNNIGGNYCYLPYLYMVFLVNSFLYEKYRFLKIKYFLQTSAVIICCLYRML